MRRFIDQQLIDARPADSADDDDFVARTMHAVKTAQVRETFSAAKRTSSVQNLRGANAMKVKQSTMLNIKSIKQYFSTRAGLLSMAGVVVIGSTAAISLWPRPSVTPTTTKPLPSGNHIVGYNAKNCDYFDINHNPSKPTNEMVYYEVRQGAKLTDQQIQNSLQGTCEANQHDAAVSRYIKRLPQNTPGMMSTIAYTVTDISASHISLTPDSHYDKSMLTLKNNITYTKFAANLPVYDEDTKVPYSSLKSGDTVVLIVQDTSGKSTETNANYQPLNHPENIRLLTIIKVPALTGDPLLLERSFVRDIVRVEPCHTSPTGFCRAYEFIDSSAK